MGTLTGQSILDRARDKVNDEDNIKRWNDVKGLNYINDAQRAIVMKLPRANTLRAVPTAVAGTRQTLNDLGLLTGIQVLDVVCNYNLLGTVRGGAITLVDRAELDARDRNWHAKTDAEAYHWMFNEDDPTAFYIVPAITSGKIEVIYAGAPADLASLASTIALPDIYANAIQWFLLFSFNSKDAGKPNGAQQAATYYSLFLQELGLRDQSISVQTARIEKNQAGGV